MHFLDLRVKGLSTNHRTGIHYTSTNSSHMNNGSASTLQIKLFVLVTRQRETLGTRLVILYYVAVASQ